MNGRARRWWKTPLGVGLIVGACMLVIICGVIAVLVTVRSSSALYFTPSASMMPTLETNDHFLVNKLAYRSEQPQFRDVVVFWAKSGMPGDNEKRVFVSRVIGVPGDTIRVTGGYVTVDGTYYRHRDMRNAIMAGRKDYDGGAVKFAEQGVVVDGKLIKPDSLVKALSGSPNAKVRVVPGRVYRNGRMLDEPYTAEDCDVDYPAGALGRKWAATVDGHRVVRIPRGYLLVMGDNRNDANDGRYRGLLPVSDVIGKALTIVSPSERAGLIK